jgi:hypothetical protein
VGASVAYDAWGDCLGELDEHPGVLRCDIDVDAARAARPDFCQPADRVLDLPPTQPRITVTDQAEHPTFCRPAEGLRFGRTRIGLQTGRFPWNGLDRPAPSPESVRPDADAQADCARKKGLQMQAF